ncbi:serine/threonine-protein kinase [Streptomyces xanthophaeus]|uniref:serine/threonine-protein kinase n=1 Tax=Streptomyces xanthophaeus TaxID=67385 RepID=UPI00264A30AE|nr:serine/threonine-protein kinase [Streptomyces xanthophaeus]WKD33934.1 serine/threonine protein kinase [Streptomyces xanthophaeus]
MEALRDVDPAQIGAHALLARLGAGGMGQVYLGRSPGGRLVAVKVIRDEITGHPEALARFRREAETVRAVRSAYTANLIDASLAAAPYWLATEYVAGPTLGHAVAERGGLPADTCRRLFAALAEGLASVHAYGVTHRDLKPQNVILGAQGPQLIDFGIARGVGETALTQDGQAPGTPGYTAPEVLLGAEAGAAADVFALGATLAYAATGRPPFGTGVATTVSYRAVHEPVDVAGVEPGLAGLIEACVAKDPAVRPGLREVIARCGVRDALVDDRVYVGLGALGEAVPVHEMRTQGPGLVPEYTPTRGVVAAASPKRGRPGVWVAAGVALAVVGAVAVWKLPLGGQGGQEGADDRAGGRTPAGQAPAGQTPSGQSSGGTAVQSPAGPPTYIRQTEPNLDDYNPIHRTCTRGPEDRGILDFQTALPRSMDDPGLKSGKVEIGYRVKDALPDAPPYYVAVVVKPQHEVDENGRSTDVSDNRQLGFVAKARDLYEGDEVQWKFLTYPDDFSMQLNGKTVKAPPLSQDPGGWTVVFRHAVSDTEHKSIQCDGFDSGPQKG